MLTERSTWTINLKSIYVQCKTYFTLLKTFMMTRNKITSSDILPGTTYSRYGNHQKQPNTNIRHKILQKVKFYKQHVFIATCKLMTNLFILSCKTKHICLHIMSSLKITFGSMIKLIQETVTNKMHGMQTQVFIISEICRNV